MSQDSTTETLVPTPLGEIPLGAPAWRAIERLAGEARAIAAGGRLRTERGEEVYVVVVERGTQALPEAALLRTRFRLTRREAEVALLLGQRHSNREIAELLYVTDRTARRHTELVLLKLGAANRREVRTILLRLVTSGDHAAAA